MSRLLKSPKIKVFKKVFLQMNRKTQNSLMQKMNLKSKNRN